eukprot:830069-Lingulodinium_polyedra.AAC.1
MPAESDRCMFVLSALAPTDAPRCVLPQSTSSHGCAYGEKKNVEEEQASSCPMEEDATAAMSDAPPTES